MNLDEKTSNPTDLAPVIRRWAETLHSDYQIDTAKAFPKLESALAAFDRIGEVQQRYEADGAAYYFQWEREKRTEKVVRLRGPAAIKIADSPELDYDSIVAIATESFQERPREEYDHVLDVIMRARSRLSLRVVEAFSSGNPAKLLVPALRTAVKTVTELASALPLALTTIDEAKTLGLENEYTALSNATEGLHKIYQLVGVWRVNGILASEGVRRSAEYNPLEFKFANPDAYFDPAIKLCWEPMRLAAAFNEGKPGIYTIEDIDHVRPSYSPPNFTNEQVRRGRARWFQQQDEMNDEIRSINQRTLIATMPR